MTDLFQPDWLYEDEEAQKPLPDTPPEERGILVPNPAYFMTMSLPDTKKAPLGWVCPVCGRGVAPSEKYCECRR